MTVSTVHATAPVGATLGSFAVSPSGAATYSIPIFVPPGTNGMQPQLSLNYNSQSGNGLVGMGWSIDGLSVIHRCGSTIAIDGIKGGVNYDTNDKFCLDGERLIVINGTYGAAGSEYRTQHESWQKVVAVGDTAGDPSYFTVTSKDGTVQYYGYDVDGSNSRIEAQGKPIARLWALSKIQDRNGNYLKITYYEDNANGDYRPTRIDYTGNGSVLPYNSVVFGYVEPQASRLDIVPLYEGGSFIKTLKRLTHVYVYAGASLAREYRLVYDPNGGAMGRSRLTSIRECGSDGICLPGTTLAWSSVGTLGFNAAPAWSGLTYLGPDPSRQNFVDVNGDGLPDWIHNNGQGGGIVHLNNGQGGFNAAPAWSGLTYLGPDPARQKFVDVNGDGLPDWIHNNGQGGGIVHLNSGLVPDQLTQATNGFGVQTNVIYKPLTDSTVYTPDVAPYKCAGYPCQDVRNAMYVVSQITQSDGIGGNNTTNIGYGGLKSHVTAGTSLGFRWMQTADPTGLVTRTTYNQITTADNSLNGIEGTPFSAETWFGNVRVKYTGNSWLPMNPAPGPNRTFALLTDSVEETRELDNSVVTTVSSSSTYDGYGNPLSILTTHAVGGANDGWTKTTYNSYDNDAANWYLGRLTRSQVVSTAPGQPVLTRTSSFGYDGFNRLTSEVIEPDRTDNLKLTTSYLYDAFGNRTSKTVSGTDIVTRTELQTFDAQGRFVTSKTNALGHTETYITDGRYGAVTSLTGPNNITTSWSYDGFGRKIGETRADGSTSTISYMCWDYSVPASGGSCSSSPVNGAIYAVKTEASGAGDAWTFYDMLGRPVHTARISFLGPNNTALWVYSFTTYDNLGRSISVSRPDFNSTYPAAYNTVFTYDNLGRVLTATAPGNRVTTTEYSGLTTTVTLTAPNTQTQTKSTIKNSQGKVVSSTDTAGNTASYVYDAIGNLVQVTDPLGNVSTMTYNIRGFKIAMHDPDMGNWSYNYDALGQLKTQTDAKGQTINMDYDKLGRMTIRALPNGEGTSNWYYDTAAKGVGKLASVTNPNANESYAYDGLGRLSTATTSISGVPYTVTTAYDAYSRVDTITYPETGFALKHVYDPYSFGFLQEVKNASTNASYWKINTGGVDAMNRILSETYGNNLISTHAYDAVTGDLATIQTGVSGNLTSVQNESYSFDGVSNLLSRSWWDGTASRSETFGYDNLNRLISVTGPVAKTYNYDTIGNITFKSDVGNYAYNSSGTNSVRPHAVTTTTGGAVTTSFTYDANGNMLTGNGKTVTYASFNKAKTIQKGSTTTTLTYDASFNRIVKSNSGGATIYIGKLYERTTNGSTITQKHYIYAGNNIIGVYSKVNTTTSTRYFHTDNLGSVAVITNATGGVVQRLSYDAWGKRRNANGTDTTGITAQTIRGFTSHEHDDEVALINMNAREYDPIIARFISPDSIVPGALNSQAYNRYTYVNNNPLSYIDPSGHFSLKKAVQNVARAAVGSALVGSGTFAVAYAATHKQEIAKFTTNALQRVSQTKYVGGLMSVGLLTNNEFGLMYGWSTGDWKTVQQAHVTGAKMAAMAYVSGRIFDKIGALRLGGMQQVGAHAVAGGVTSVLQGGSFRDGAIAGAVSAFDYQYLGQTKDRLLSTVRAGIVGGAAAYLSGGNFEHGFVTATIARVFNDLGKDHNVGRFVGAGGAVQGGLIGVSAQSGIAWDSDNVCFQSSVCVRYGYGYSGSLGIAGAVDIMRSPLMSGEDISYTTFAEGGAGLFGKISPSLNKDATSVGVVRGLAGIGGGKAVGVERCSVRTICF
ncbi:MAG: hypothetical protein Tsb0026_03400 [Sulfuricaulis sp.]